MLADAVRVNDVVSVGGFVVPGTRVDVLLTGNPGGGGEQQTTTVLENVAVVANGANLERNSNGEPQNSPVITLLVSPDDAQKLTLAKRTGQDPIGAAQSFDTSQSRFECDRHQRLYKGVPVPVKEVTKAAPSPAMLLSRQQLRPAV